MQHSLHNSDLYNVKCFQRLFTDFTRAELNKSYVLLLTALALEPGNLSNALVQYGVCRLQESRETNFWKTTASYRLVRNDLRSSFSRVRGGCCKQGFRQSICVNVEGHPDSKPL